MMPMGQQQSQKAIAPTRTGDRSAAGLLPPTASSSGGSNNKVKSCLPTIGESGAAADETRVNKNLEKIKVSFKLFDLQVWLCI